MSKSATPITILYADDDAEDRMLVKDAWEESHVANEMAFVEDGEELMDYLHRRGKYTGLANTRLPGLILLDLNMPRKDGREALKEIKSDPVLRSIPIVVLTTSKAEEDILRTYNLHANCYVTKPVDLDQFVKVVKSLEDFWLAIVKLPNHKQ